ncbi:exonuclease SbcCD subunit D [Effusibacillus lacus]|uniref:Nuclease SbcCD subunit D n=1 Tax=Effusibacillus lacus TaxID=1348429 RepID=A0A292YIX2_9BACL|nr:exonuclease SbcCD subunit D [Effusibacillus lacus]TCS75718.1 exodeoxyribonuclease I subunit D [Effusibacillus lacus]GAX91037.1 exonuclease sbcCD subunit D [Effusibacillus lacus]
MRILHTADWHFGKTLEGRDRLPEQAQFVEELCEICEQEAVDLVLMAGDVYQTANPSAAAEDLFYYAVDRLSANGRRGVVVIAGNHDNPDRLVAASPLAHRNGIILIGRPHDEIVWAPGPSRNRVQVVEAGPSWLKLRIPGVDHHAVIAALPYPSESRLRELLTRSTEDAELRKEYNAQIAYIFEKLTSHYRRDTVNLAMSHLYVQGGQMSESEHQIQVGGAYSVDPGSFPEIAQYVALGHLHRPQGVSASPVPTRYSGSPLAYSFSECNHKKSVVLIEATPGIPAQIREIPLSSGKPLVKWTAEGGIRQVQQWVEEGRDPLAWIDLTVHVETALTMEDIQLLRAMHEGFVNIRPVFPDLNQTLSAAEVKNLSDEEMFIRFYERQTNGATPEPELVRLFLELTADVVEEEESVESEEMAG